MRRIFYSILVALTPFVFASKGGSNGLSEILNSLNDIKDVLSLSKSDKAAEKEDRSYHRDVLLKNKLAHSDRNFFLLDRNGVSDKAKPTVTFALEVSAGSIDQSFSFLSNASYTQSTENTDGEREKRAERGAIFLATKNYRLNLQKDADSNLRPYLSGRFVASANLGNQVALGAYMSMESTPEDARFLYLAKGDGLKDHGSDFVRSEIRQKHNDVFAPGVFILFGGVGPVMEYDTRSYIIPKVSDSGVVGNRTDTTVETLCSDSQILLGFRGQGSFGFRSGNMDLVIQYTRKFMMGKYTNRSSDTIEDVFQNNFDYWDSKADEDGTQFPLEAVFPHIHKLTIGVGINIGEA